MTISAPKTPVLQSPVNSPVSSKGLRLLFLVPFAPNLQASHGGSRVIAQLMDHLAQRHSIGLCYLRAAQEPRVDEGLMQRCDVVEEVLLPTWEGSRIQRWSRHLWVWKELMMGKPLWAIDRFSSGYAERVQNLMKTWQPDIVQIEFHIMGQYLSALAGYSAPRILVQHEPGEEATREIMSSSFRKGRIISRLDLLAWKRFEPKITRQVQSVVVFTERDQEMVSKLGQETPIVTIPLGTEIPELSPSRIEAEPSNLLFVGNFKHLPNLDAADRLMNRIFPRVRAQFPEARLFIVGDHLPADIVPTPNQGVTLTGYVPDVKPYLDQATLVVVPLRLGGGMRVKVLEALAAGKPVIASPRAVEGLDLVNGEQIMLAEDDNQFSNAIAELLDDSQKRALLATRARAWACENLSWANVACKYEALYHGLLRC